MSLKRSLVLAAALTLSGQALASDPLKVGFVYVGPIGDHG
jgi:simple sugar transport system substrate-binding protein|tara:strand:- start:1044 stop:1163 length:120 start_codon:yes stop_codon:yes gene_type:complete